jgi:hypothetical protein
MTVAFTGPKCRRVFRRAPLFKRPSHGGRDVLEKSQKQPRRDVLPLLLTRLAESPLRLGRVPERQRSGLSVPPAADELALARRRCLNTVGRL